MLPDCISRVIPQDVIRSPPTQHTSGRAAAHTWRIWRIGNPGRHYSGRGPSGPRPGTEPLVPGGASGCSGPAPPKSLLGCSVSCPTQWLLSQVLLLSQGISTRPEHPQLLPQADSGTHRPGPTFAWYAQICMCTLVLTHAGTLRHSEAHKHIHVSTQACTSH